MNNTAFDERTLIISDDVFEQWCEPPSMTFGEKLANAERVIEQVETSGIKRPKVVDAWR